jgi:hypothetical protein
LISWCPVVVALGAAVGLATVGIVRGTYAAGGSDSSCYALMAEAFASGELRPTSTLATQVPWPDAPKTFTPGGFLPSESDPAASAPVCAPGFAILLAPSIKVGGLDALFSVTPIFGALLVWMTFLAARTLAGPLAGAMAAVLIATSPPVLYQVVQPMNDIATAALWMAAFVALTGKRWALAGALCGLVLLVRPNLLPLGIVAGGFVIASGRSVTPVGEPIPDSQSLTLRLSKFCFAVLPFGLTVLTLNNAIYGSPLRTGYGQPGHLFAMSHLPITAMQYPGWLVETHTPFPFLALAAPFVVSEQKRRDVLLALALIASTCGIYLIYTPFDDWSYLRFLLPAIGLMLTLASAVAVRILSKVLPEHGLVHAGRYVVAGAMTMALAIFCVRAAADRHAFALQSLEQRYRSAGIVVRERLPEGAVVLSVWESGSVRFHGRKEALTWDGLDPAWLDRSLAWLDQHHRRPYILLESWEEPGFRTRFGSASDIGQLDWPPKYEIDRKVRIYDPRDRDRYQRGERVDTEFLWPLRD